VISGEPREEKRAPSVNKSSNEEDSVECLNQFGYLANRDKGTPIPQECINCLKVLKCIEFNL
jgi:hypothetical protein